MNRNLRGSTMWHHCVSILGSRYSRCCLGSGPMKMLSATGKPEKCVFVDSRFKLLPEGPATDGCPKKQA